MQPDLNNLKNKIKDNRDFIDRIAVGIPAFKGYVEKSENYDADSMIRGFIADKMLSLKKTLNTLAGDLVRKTKLDSVQDLESLSTLLEGILKKVQYADYGNSGSFSKIKFTDEDQNRLLEYDWRLISSFDEAAKLLSDIESGNISDNIDAMKAKLREFEKNFDDRKYVILEVI